jgi:hypothetical protein
MYDASTPRGARNVALVLTGDAELAEKIEREATEQAVLSAKLAEIQAIAGAAE